MFIEELKRLHIKHKSEKSWWIDYCICKINNTPYYFPYKPKTFTQVHVEWADWYNPFYLNYPVLLNQKEILWKKCIKKNIEIEMACKLSLPVDLKGYILQYI